MAGLLGIAEDFVPPLFLGSSEIVSRSGSEQGDHFKFTRSNIHREHCSVWLMNGSICLHLIVDRNEGWDVNFRIVGVCRVDGSRVPQTTTSA